MKSSKAPKLPLSILVFLIAAGVPAHAAQERQSVRVTQVLTGDSVRLEGGKTLKYAGVSSPPLQHLLPLVREYGGQALEFNRKLTDGKTLQIEWGPQLRDESNNLLGYAFLEDGTFVNREILSAGWGKSAAEPPNIRYAAVFRRAELEARRGRKGLWREEPQNPYIQSEYVGEKNTKIFYFPTSPELERIPAANLVTFRSRVEALAAGYRACHACREENRGGY